MPAIDNLNMWLTGDRENGRVKVVFSNGHTESEVWLTAKMLELLVDLVLALSNGDGCSIITPSDGDIERARILIFRLRKEIDRGINPGSGKQIIATGLGTEYKLCVSRSHIAITSDFFSLPHGVLSPADRERLRENFPILAKLPGPVGTK